MGKEQSFNITNMRNFFAKENMEKLFADCPTITLKKNECIYATEQILTGRRDIDDKCSRA